MPITSLLTRTDGSAGRTKANARAIVSLLRQVPAEEWNNVAQAVVDLLAEVGLSDGSTPGSLVERVTDLEGGGGGGGFSHVAISGNATLPASNAIIDVDAGTGSPTTLTLTVPAAASGRLYIVRKLAGGADRTITLAPAASEMIDGTAVSRVLPGSREPSYDDYANHVVWTVTCDGTNWHTAIVSNQTLHTKSATAPAGDADETTGYLPGSTWCEAVQDPGSKLHMNMGTDAASADWMRVDAVAVSEIAYGDSPYDLPLRDRQIDVTTAGGAVVLAHPGAPASDTSQLVGVQHVVMKTNTGTNKITLEFGVSTSVNGAAGATTYDLPGSDVASHGLWRITIRAGVVWVSGGAGLV